MATEIAVMLAVNDAQAAVEFYKKAFGAELYWTVGDSGHMVAGSRDWRSAVFSGDGVAGVWHEGAVGGGIYDG